MKTPGFLRGVEPDFNRMLRVLRRDGLPDRVPFAEFYYDQPALAAMLYEKPVSEHASNRQQTEACWRQRIRFFRNFGMDFIPVPIASPTWEQFRRMTSKDMRLWVSEAGGFDKELPAHAENRIGGGTVLKVRRSRRLGSAQLSPQQL